MKGLKLVPGDAGDSTEKLSEHYIEAQTSLVGTSAAHPEGGRRVCRARYTWGLRNHPG